jgi:hypothetical protein
VASTGPLLSLLRAADVRQDFLRINRDLSNCFNILGAGEKLIVS